MFAKFFCLQITQFEYIDQPQLTTCICFSVIRIKIELVVINKNQKYMTRIHFNHIQLLLYNNGIEKY